ncbi:MAG: hypothetical protein ACI4NM_06220 [Bullifex sp.]
MAVNYYGWGIGGDGYSGVVKIDEHCNAYYYDRLAMEWVLDNYHLKAKWDPSCDYEEITEEEAKKTIRRITSKKR